MSSWCRWPGGTAPEAEGKLVPCPRPPPARRPAAEYWAFPLMHLTFMRAQRARVHRARLKAIRHRKLSVTWRPHPLHPLPLPLHPFAGIPNIHGPSGRAFCFVDMRWGIDWSLMCPVIITNVLLLSILICYNIASNILSVGFVCWQLLVTWHSVRTMTNSSFAGIFMILFDVFRDLNDFFFFSNKILQKDCNILTKLYSKLQYMF